MRILLLVILCVLVSCKQRTSSTVLEATTRGSIGSAVCVDPNVLLPPTAVNNRAALEVKTRALNECFSAVSKEPFSFGALNSGGSCRCAITSGKPPAAFIPALSCGFDKEEAENPSCMMVRVKGCTDTKMGQIFFVAANKRLSCIQYAKEQFPSINVRDSSGDMLETLTDIVHKSQLTTPKCQAAVVTKQDWAGFIERRPGFAKNADIFRQINMPGNIISCATREDVKWLQARAFAEGGNSCLRASTFGFGSCMPSSILEIVTQVPVRQDPTNPAYDDEPTFSVPE